MRIISGIHGGRKIHPPAKMPHTRPTTDIAKEGLFNIIQNNLEIEELEVLDLFGGTGCISYELASRGALTITIVEKDNKMYDFIKKTSAELKFENFNIVKLDVFKFIESNTRQYDFIFAGPPYALATIDELPVKIFEHNLLKPGGWFVLEHTPRNDYKKFAHYKTERNYGTTIFSIFINN
ncbi:MAG: RsmD family RNA methyltransferase [Ferruginibacter sp.]|nr:RsmD family RNA methyltransferase [Bacteroidota bacterium]MBX2918588.1 RsmD family RNA methyltransferase [Ferruginibacter sp.]MCB0709624.1 RsmD family RNA methyltransferase [Chitinophagaceae bacterium]